MYGCRSRNDIRFHLAPQHLEEIWSEKNDGKRRCELRLLADISIG